MLNILIVYTFFIPYLEIILTFLFCPQLVVKTKYIDALIKLLLTMLFPSDSFRRISCEGLWTLNLEHCLLSNTVFGGCGRIKHCLRFVCLTVQCRICFTLSALVISFTRNYFFAYLTKKECSCVGSKKPCAISLTQAL